MEKQRSYLKPESQEVRMLSRQMKITKKSDKKGKTGAPRKEEMREGTRACCVSQYVLENYLSSKVCACSLKIEIKKTTKKEK